MKILLIFILLCLPGLNSAQPPEDLRSKAYSFSISADELNSGRFAAPITPQPADDSDIGSIFNHLSSLSRSDSGNLSISRSGNAIVIKNPDAFSKSAYSDTYKYGDAAFLIGHLEDDWTKSEWTRYYGVAKWLVKKGFRVIMNPVAMIADIRATVQDNTTKVIIWSSHGSKNGNIYDKDKNTVPTDIFAQNAGVNFKQIIVGSCYSSVMVEKYSFPAGLKKTSWNGTTDSDDLFGYLNSREWDPTTLGENIQ